MQQQHHYQQLIDLFDSCFAEEFNTRLIKGDDEGSFAGGGGILR